MVSSFLAFAEFGTGEGLLRYGIRIRCSKRLPVYATHFQRHSVLKTGFWGTEGIFGAGEGLLWYGSDTRSWSRFEDAAECGSRFEDTAECGPWFEDATVVGVVPVVAAMDLLA